MRLRTPLYLAFGSAVLVYLASAGWNGWSLLGTAARLSRAPGTHAATRHK